MSFKVKLTVLFNVICRALHTFASNEPSRMHRAEQRQNSGSPKKRTPVAVSDDNLVHLYCCSTSALAATRSSAAAPLKDQQQHIYADEITLLHCYPVAAADSLLQQQSFPGLNLHESAIFLLQEFFTPWEE
ncbi:hypothetical protein Salat_2292100 [Sesamum alatum]|uniref:Uncharacterized protein n=1 Tax=Sesamum alatum TaxID=300844 RepID=A0AAE1XVF5_9LAMI|nr:hypothetical protein Salat_2292100 [Sesamum alatum]